MTGGETRGEMGEGTGEETREETPRVRRRGRTALLIATAAVLGLVGGACAGYLIQADREPTKLPSLSQPVVAQAKGAGPEPCPPRRTAA